MINEFDEVQIAELQRLRAIAGEDPVLKPQLDERIKELEGRIALQKAVNGTLLPTDYSLPRAAIFLSGGGVSGQRGIHPILAGEALIQYDKMFIEQALYDERNAARSAGRQRRLRGTPMPGLLFTGTPRGSFGLEFVPMPVAEGQQIASHSKSLHNVANSLVRLANSDPDSFEKEVERTPSRVLQPMIKFLKTVAEYGANVRLAFDDQSSNVLSNEKIKQTAERLDKDVHQEQLDVTGVFRGVTHETGYFDLKVNDDVLSGYVADDLTEDDIERLDKLLNKTCVAELQKTTVSRISGSPYVSYVLINAKSKK